MNPQQPRGFLVPAGRRMVFLDPAGRTLDHPQAVETTRSIALDPEPT